MKYSPHDYQKYAADFIVENPIAAILLDMGMGKSVITLTAVYELMYEFFEVQRVLVIAPLRVAKNTWPAEIEKWDHLKGLTYSVAVGTPAERIAALNDGADVTIINRENISWLIEESGVPWSWDMVVIDELSSFKNHKAKRFRSLMKARPKVKRIVGLTGTPSSNGLMDLFAEFKVLDMGKRLGRFIGQYRDAYFTPDRMNGPIVYSYALLPGAEDEIYRKISDITISMKCTDHLQMPKKIITQAEAVMSDAETARYEKMKKELVLQLDGEEITAANAASLSGKLCQMANGAVYSDNGKITRIHDRKLDVLEDIIEAANGKPLLVAYWFRHDFERITERLADRKIPFEKLDSDDSIRRWNRKEIPVGLIHPASAGHGLNLQDGGSTIVWFGLTWSLELYQQTNARLWRQGQQSDTVVIQHIVTKGTIDGQILRALSDKNDTQSALIDAVKAVM
jgi:SNF2 family DNA or RNA helicase